VGRSLADIQAEVLDEGLLDQLGSERTASDDVPVLERLVAIVAAEFVKAVRDNLDKAGKVSTGGLSDGVAAGQIISNGSKVTVQIGYDPSDPASTYWDFVNEGVQGIISKQPSTSPYRFRKLSAPPVMVDAIESWVKRNNLSARNEDQRRNLSALQSKRQKIRELGDPTRSLAYAIALNIKRRGLPYTGFWNNAVRDYLGKEFINAVAKAAGADIRVQIRRFNPSGKK
jgi:hypothetical protein